MDIEEFYDKLVDKLIEHNEVKKIIRKLSKTKEYKMSCVCGRFRLVLDEFFNCGYDKIFEVDEIFEKVKSDISEDFEYIVAGKQRLIKAAEDKIGGFVDEILGNIKWNIYNAFVRRIRKLYSQLP